MSDSNDDDKDPKADPWDRAPDIAILGMRRDNGLVLACKIGTGVPIDAAAVGAYLAVLLRTAHNCNGGTEPFDVFCADVTGQMHRALMRHTRLDPDAPEN